MRRVITAGFWLLALTPVLASTPVAECQQQGAAAAEEPRLDIRGFGGWAAGYANNLNTYMGMANNDVEVNNYEFALNLLARPFENITIHAQPSWQPVPGVPGGNDLRIDLVYAEWKFLPGLKVEAGKIKNPIGLYTDIYKVGTLRPFYLLPAAMYRNVPHSYVGGGLSGVKHLGEWELEGHVLGGQIDLDPRPQDQQVGVNPATQQPIYRTLQITGQGRDFVGGGTVLSLPDKGLKISAQVYTLKLWAAVAGQAPAAVIDTRTGKPERTRAYSAAVEYVNDRVTLRAEGMVARKPTDFNTAYVEAAYKFDEHWQLAAQYDFFERTAPPAIVNQLRDHQVTSVGLNYWVKPNLVWKLNYSHVFGNYLARSADALGDALAGRLDDTTEVLIAGVQFSF
jgi:hypothetical protein